MKTGVRWTAETARRRSVEAGFRSGRVRMRFTSGGFDGCRLRANRRGSLGAALRKTARWRGADARSAIRSGARCVRCARRCRGCRRRGGMSALRIRRARENHADEDRGGVPKERWRGRGHRSPVRAGTRSRANQVPRPAAASRVVRGARVPRVARIWSPEETLAEAKISAVRRAARRSARRSSCPLDDRCAHRRGASSSLAGARARAHSTAPRSHPRSIRPRFRSPSARERA